jgi:aldehyde dehydrogenase (NAD+)
MTKIATPTIPTAPDTPVEQIHEIFEKQLVHQYTVRRTTAQQRIARLKQLHDTIYRRRPEIERAIYADFRKSKTETDISEVGVSLGEIRHTMRHLKTWMRTQSVGTPLTLFGSSSEIMQEPKGVCLIISPWNYPFNLSFAPLASALAAGNCVILKPSEYTPNSSAVIKSIIEECFAPEEVFVAEGGVSVSQALLELPFNHIFFTGSPTVGKIVMAAAAKHLTSVTLELGGKSPVVIDNSADLDHAAAQTAWLKTMNAGQICIAPDYILVHESVKEAFIAKMVAKIETFYGKDAAARQASPDICRLVNARHFARVKSLLDDAMAKGATIAHGGFCDEADLFIETTLLVNVPENAEIWQEEIFGPLLPIRTWTELDEVTEYINARPKPLAMYLFSHRNRVIQHLLTNTRNGGVTVNDCGPHFYNSELPFGGSNNSGIGKCHGIYGFQEFSNARSVLRQTRILPTSRLMLPPYGGKLAEILLKGIVRWF